MPGKEWQGMDDSRYALFINSSFKQGGGGGVKCINPGPNLAHGAVLFGPQSSQRGQNLEVGGVGKGLKSWVWDPGGAWKGGDE